MQQLLKQALMPIIGHATSKYVAGDRLEDALDLAARARQQDLACSLCYWNDGSEDPGVVAAEYLSILNGFEAEQLDGILALKVPALWDREEEVERVIDRARRTGTTIVLDSHAPEQADANFRLIEKFGGTGLGLAIPGRWGRSARDAERAIELGARVRVVKGEWIDPENPQIDLREGYLDVVRRLAGRARFVGVATHDPVLAGKAMEILAEAGTPFEQEFVFPLPIEAAQREGARFNARARLYIPYGEAWLPYSLKRAFKNPKTFYWLARDMFGGRKFELPELPRNEALAGAKPS